MIVPCFGEMDGICNDRVKETVAIELARPDPLRDHVVHDSYLIRMHVNTPRQQLLLEQAVNRLPRCVNIPG